MSKQYDILFFIGRFQPLHLGHETVIKKALLEAETVVILVGSANRSTSIRNPFTFQERNEMLTYRYRHEVANGQIEIHPLNDYLYNDPAWVAQLQKIISRLVPSNCKMGVIGHANDHVSYNTDIFKSLNLEVCEITVENTIFHSTHIRSKYLQNFPILPQSICSERIVDYLEKFIHTKRFGELVAEQKFVDDYKKAWASAPFPPTFNTVDAVVTQSGHILLIERGEQPGKGQLALPGGFINVNETLKEAVIRELLEETAISDGKFGTKAMPPAVLASYIRNHETFDDPDRSTRGRTITEAYHFELPDKAELFHVKGSDDAAHAKWYPLGTISSDMFYEDHYFIMCNMLGLTM